MPKVNPKTKPDLEVFAEVMAATKSPTRAMIAAQPHLITNRRYASNKGQRLAKKPDIQAKIQQKLEKMSKNAIKTIDKLVASENEQVATVNSWRVIEHLRGKPVARSVNLHASASIEDALLD